MRWFFFIIIYTLIDFYALQAIRTLTKNSWITGIYLFVSLVVIVSLYFLLNSNSSTHFSQPPISYLFGLFLVTPEIIKSGLIAVQEVSTRMPSRLISFASSAGMASDRLERHCEIVHLTSSTFLGERERQK